MLIHLKNKETLQIDLFKFKCSTGKKGLTKNKKEGDMKTPKGIFSLGHLFYRKDRNLITKFYSSFGNLQWKISLASNNSNTRHSFSLPSNL